MSESNSQSLTALDRRFIQRLQTFASKGYKFDGSDHALKPGTQHEAFDGFLKGLTSNHRHGYFDVPTGVGKTALFLSLIENYLNAANGQKDGKRVLVVVPNVTLVKQTANAFAKFMPEIAPKLEADDDSGHAIDWENSQIGVQYQKVKHAEKKPRVLITTYASLRQDKANQIYDPDEFGLVVYDEGHSITAKESGKAVEKFKDALQLAVTATPDYDDDEKRVDKKLAHCYYRLPLAEAIKRGDLCGVRPILIKTNYTVDAAKVEEYLKINRGNHLTDAQLQNLFNVEARNRSVIDTYLADRDPDSGERFLGQQGLIFSGGITHANDLVSQFYKALGENRFAKIRQWLAEENLEVAAAIHSSAKGAWLRPGMLTDEEGKPLGNRIRQARREWYSEDEVRLLHERGKILLLISDKKLREGYDCPKDSFIVDMVDRLSVVDVTQRCGRGFRLDPEDPEKVCTPINLVDANTYEIYKNRPQMLPIYASEILDGAEFRKPMKRKLTRQFRHEIPEASEALDHGRFEVISDPEAVRQLDNKQRREKAKDEKAKAGWIAASAIRTEFGGSGRVHMANIVALRQEKITELLENGLPEALAITEVEEKWVAWRRGKRGVETWHVSPEGLDELIRAGKVKTERAPLAKAGWLSGAAIAREYGGAERIHNANIAALREVKSAELSANGMSKTEVDREVEEKWVQWASKGGQETWHISPQGMQELIRLRQVRIEQAPHARSEWLTGSMIEKKYGGTMVRHNGNIQALGEEKLAELCTAGVPKDQANREVEDKWVAWRTGSRGDENWFVSPEGLQELICKGKINLDRALSARDDWLSGAAIGIRYGGHPQKHIKNIVALGDEKFAILRSAGISEEQAKLEVEDKWVAWRRNKKGQEGWHISPEGLQELLEQGKLQSRNKSEANQGQSWAARTGPANPNPTKRSGRTRGGSGSNDN